jgi:hypothetical protein
VQAAQDRITVQARAWIAIITVDRLDQADVSLRIAGSSRAGVSEASAVVIVAAHHASATAADQAKSA